MLLGVSRSSLSGLSILVALWLFGSVAHATIAEALSMAQLVEEADHAALVEVVALDPGYDELDRIVTDVTVRVIEPLVGSSRAGDLLVVRRLGGVVGDVGLRIEGEATFVLGERVVLFVEEISGFLRPVGMSQGVLPVQRDAHDGEVVLPGGAGLSLVRPGDPALTPARGALARARAIDEVLAEIRELGAERR